MRRMDLHSTVNISIFTCSRPFTYFNTKDEIIFILARFGIKKVNGIGEYTLNVYSSVWSGCTKAGIV